MSASASTNTLLPDQPPSYADTTNRPTITDLRAQILANASVLRPKVNPNRPSDDHLEITVARYLVQPINNGGNSKDPSEQGSHPVYKYYAVLVTRARGMSSGGVRVAIKGQPRASEREALEWLLGETEDKMHRMVQTSSRDADECVVM